MDFQEKMLLRFIDLYSLQLNRKRGLRSDFALKNPFL
jgi:hypothetical protein